MFTMTTPGAGCDTHLVKDGEVTVCCKDAGQDAITEVSVSNVTSWTHT